MREKDVVDRRRLDIFLAQGCEQRLGGRCGAGIDDRGATVFGYQMNRIEFRSNVIGVNCRYAVAEIRVMRGLQSSFSSVISPGWAA